MPPVSLLFSDICQESTPSQLGTVRMKYILRRRGKVVVSTKAQRRSPLIDRWYVLVPCLHAATGLSPAPCTSTMAPTSTVMSTLTHTFSPV